MTDGVIQKYGELKQTINEVIQTKKAEAIQSAMEDSYTDAIKNQTQLIRITHRRKKMWKRHRKN